MRILSALTLYLCGAALCFGFYGALDRERPWLAVGCFAAGLFCFVVATPLLLNLWAQ